MKEYRNGLIVGKFCPLHNGHEYLIRTALTKCEKLFVLSYTRPEFTGFEPEKRQRWLRSLFPEVWSIVISENSALSDFGLNMPDNDASENEHRAFVASIWPALVGEPLDVVFTSENYGDGFAQYLTEALRGRPGQAEVDHFLVDIERKAHNISGTAIRKDVHANRAYLPPIIYSSFVKRVCLIGAESTGKSTLAQLLAERLNTVHIEEFGRTLWEEKGGKLELDDMLQIALTHIRSEEVAAAKANRFLIVDTTPLTTLLYSQHLFAVAEDQLKVLATRKYDLTFLCFPDFPMVQDGTRRNESFRQLQHRQYLEQLEKRDIDYISLQGPLDVRLDFATRSLLQYC